MDFKFILCVLLLQTLNVAWSQAPETPDPPKPSKTYKIRTDGIPSFCKDKECPPFTVTDNNSWLYEQRFYPASKWVTTKVNGKPYAKAESIMYWRLRRYFSGSNSKSQRFNLTLPSVKKLLIGPDNSLTQNYTMSFYLPPTFGIPPTPNDTRVEIRTVPQFTAYVRAFKGRPSLEGWINETITLQQAVYYPTYYRNFFYTANYNSPFDDKKRHNEIWLIKY